MNTAVAWVALRTIVRREVHRILRIWGQTLVPPAITMTLYFVIFGRMIGARIGSMDGLPYIDFIVPGLIMMAVIQNSYGNIVSSFFGAKFQHFIEEMLVSPTPNAVILAGYVIGAMLRGFLVGAIVLVVAMGFTDLRLLHPLITLLTLLLASLVFAFAGFIKGGTPSPTECDPTAFPSSGRARARGARRLALLRSAQSFAPAGRSNVAGRGNLARRPDAGLRRRGSAAVCAGDGGVAGRGHSV